MNQKKLYTLVGATVALMSLIRILDISTQDKVKRAGTALSFTLAITGLIAGTAIACLPERNARRQLTVGELLDDKDVERMQKNISEILGDDPT